MSLLPTHFSSRLRQLQLPLAVLALFFGLIGLVLVQLPLLSESQDIRQQAATPDGTIIITTIPRVGTQAATTTASNVTQPQTAVAQTGSNMLDLYINTNGVIIDELKLLVSLLPADNQTNTDLASASATLAEPPVFTDAQQTQLDLTAQEVEQNHTAYMIASTFKAVSGDGFQSTAPQLLGSLELKYPVGGQFPLSVVYDAEYSTAFIKNSNPPRDALRTIPSLTLLAPGTSVEVVAAKTAEKTNKGTELRSCDQSCTTNHQCGPNLRCYEQKCRLATNVLSPTCEIKAAGAVSSCNQSCNTNNECAAGLACHANRCRNPLNLASVSCEQPAQQQVAATQTQCNQACVTHRDCPANMLCHGESSRCRLAVNPGSTSCTPAGTKTISTIYENKGGSTTVNGTQSSVTNSETGNDTTTHSGDSGDATDRTDNQTATQSSGTTATTDAENGDGQSGDGESESDSATATVAAGQNNGDSTNDETKTESTSILARINNRISSLLFGLSTFFASTTIRLIVAAIFIILAILLLLAIVLSRRSNKPKVTVIPVAKQPETKPVMQSAAPLPTVPPATTSQPVMTPPVSAPVVTATTAPSHLQSTIQTSTQTASTTPDSLEEIRRKIAEVAQKDTTKTAAVSPVATTTPPLPNNVPPSNTPPANNTNVSMLDRIKQKGIVPPQTS